jgi:hypothetical protein
MDNTEISNPLTLIEAKGLLGIPIEAEWGLVTVHTMIIGIGDKCCDCSDGVRHTGISFRTRQGKRGPFPKGGDFHASCGKILKFTPHKCEHPFPECPVCTETDKKHLGI